MNADKFKIQAYSGGPEYEFFNRTPFIRRADIELGRDKEFQGMSHRNKSITQSIAMCALAARKEGLGDVLDLPERLTVATCDEFAEEYAITLETAEIPTGEQGGAEVEDENPTGTPGATS